MKPAESSPHLAKVALGAAGPASPDELDVSLVRPQSGTLFSSVRERLTHMWDSTGRMSALGLVDQAIVSAVRFATTVAIGRCCGADELGTYTLAYTLMLTALNVQDSLIMGPFVIYVHRLDADRRRCYAGSALLSAMGLAIVACLVLACIAWSLYTWRSTPALAETIAVLGIVMPFVFLQQFGRRFAFSLFRMQTALLLDISCGTIQLAGIVFLVLQDLLTAQAAFAIIGAACALPGLVWYLQARRSFAIEKNDLRADLQQNWRIGRWMLGTLSLDTLGMLFSSWFLAALVGVSAAGVYAACLSIACLTNPILLGLSNALRPRAAGAYSEGGAAELRRISRESLILLLVATGAVVLPVIVFAQSILGVLFGVEYAAHFYVVVLLALAAFFNAASIAADQGLMALERTDWGFGSQVVGVGVMCICGLVLIPFWGVIGAACAALAGSVSKAASAIICHEVLCRAKLEGRGVA